VDDKRLSIEELADAAGLTRRGIRFYVQQQLLPTPHGVGRGKHDDQTHLARLQQIRDLQSAGHSLEEIRQIIAGNLAPSPVTEATIAHERAPALRAELWRRLRIMEGVELSFDAARFNPTVEQLTALRAAIASTFASDETDPKHKQGETP